MKTRLAEPFRSSVKGAEVDGILRSCVHCGFCTATCPTYGLLGDELDGPRGRIYLIKSLFEGQALSRQTQIHLDRCLTCRACETTCPSGVQYGRLLDAGREEVERRVKRPWHERVLRRLLRSMIPHPQRYIAITDLLRHIVAFLPFSLRRLLPAEAPRRPGAPAAHHEHRRRVLLLEGCAQSVLTPEVNNAAAQIFNALDVSVVSAFGCCGALSQHLAAESEALDLMRANIDRWWPEVEGGVEAVISTASGCGVTVKEYGYYLRHDVAYAAKARHLGSLTRDIAEFVASEPPANLRRLHPAVSPIAFQAPCTLQHGQRLGGVVESLLQRLGFELSPVPEAHLCCGSAGSYSVLQPRLASQLRDDKMRHLLAGSPAAIATSNVGCQLHLRGHSSVPVKHWIEMLRVL